MSRAFSPERADGAGVVIGVRDSGVGGLTVAQAIKQALPHARLLYFADTAHVPYGDREPDEVKFFALSISRFLLSHGAHALVFACNTTSAYALEDARREFSCSVTGMIEPGARAALKATRNGRIGILATQATVDSGIYTRTIARLHASCAPGELEVQVIEIGCPDFVPLVEAERTESPEALDAARKYLEPLLRADCDTVVLGCTHYPLLLSSLRLVAPHIHFADPAVAVAREVAEQVHALGGQELMGVESKPESEDDQDVFFVSGEREGVRRWVSRLLRIVTPCLKPGPVFDPAESGVERARAAGAPRHRKSDATLRGTAALARSNAKSH